MEPVHSSLAAWLAYGAVALFLVLYHKGLPFVWHIRFGALIATELLCRRRRLASLDETVVHGERVWLSDMDFNFHQNNAHYNIAAGQWRAPRQDAARA